MIATTIVRPSTTISIIITIANADAAIYHPITQRGMIYPPFVITLIIFNSTKVGAELGWVVSAVGEDINK